MLKMQLFNQFPIKPIYNKFLLSNQLFKAKHVSTFNLIKNLLKPIFNN